MKFEVTNIQCDTQWYCLLLFMSCVNLVHVEFEWACVHSRIMQRGKFWVMKAERESKSEF